ncbi:MAG TPA: hypothetical protein VFZ73_09710, partial [Gemmatimonadaceae bacterium]
MSLERLIARNAEITAHARNVSSHSFQRAVMLNAEPDHAWFFPRGKDSGASKGHAKPRMTTGALRSARREFIDPRLINLAEESEREMELLAWGPAHAWC